MTDFDKLAQGVSDGLKRIEELDRAEARRRAEAMREIIQAAQDERAIWEHGFREAKNGS